MITDTFLSELAKDLNGESALVPSWLAFGSDVIVPNAGSTDLAGDYTERFALTGSRSSNSVTVSGIRLATDVLSSSGDVLNAAALFSASSGPTLLAETTLSSILQTSAYDIEIDWKITFSRA